LEEAITELQKSIPGGDPAHLASLGHAYAIAGQKTEARKILDELEKLSQHRYVPASGFATVYTGLGETEPALDWLEKAYQEPHWYMAFLRVEPLFDPLRADPRFQELVRRMNFPE
jgi:hypothetical protein